MAPNSAKKRFGEIEQRAAAVVRRQSVSAELGVRRRVCGAGGVSRPLTLTKGIFPALASLPVFLLADHFGGLRLLARKRFRVLPRHSGMRGSREDHEALPNGVLAGYRDL